MYGCYSGGYCNVIWRFPVLTTLTQCMIHPPCGRLKNQRILTFQTELAVILSKIDQSISPSEQSLYVVE